MAARLPPQSQILLPLLDAIANAGGVARPGALYEQIAERIGLDPEARRAKLDDGSGTEGDAWRRRVRWTRQTAVAKNLISRGQRGIWELTDRANAHLRNIVRGTIVTIFETDAGVMLWANAEDALALIEPQSVDLICTSPPYPLIGKPKPYQMREDRDTSRWITAMLKLFAGWRELLTPTGSIMLNLGPVWNPGEPSQSLYMERLLVQLEDTLGVKLLQRLDWHSPTKMPAPLEWCGIRRIRVKSSIEPIFWLSPYPHTAYGSNLNVLRPYSKAGLRSIARPEDGTRRRPSGYKFGPGSFRDAGGAIPPSLIVATPSPSDAYRRAERTAGRTPHPATMPDPVAEFCIQLASQRGSLVYEPYAGKGTTALAAERLGRRWIANERSLHYIQSAQINFEANGYPVRMLGEVA
jgi:site-specific DNA-methyltransferase (cytosine-N4-specific)